MKIHEILKFYKKILDISVESSTKTNLFSMKSLSHENLAPCITSMALMWHDDVFESSQ